MSNMKSTKTAIQLSDTFSVNQVTYSEPRTNPNGGKTVYIKYNDSFLFFQTPKMPIPFGLSHNQYEEGKTPKYHLDLSFRGKDNNPQVAQFYEAMNSFDQKIIKDAMDHALPWFKKKSITRETVEEFYKPLIKYSKNDKGEIDDRYPPMFRVRVPFRENGFMCDVYDQNKEKITDAIQDVLVKQVTVQVIMQCMGLWFAGNSFGCTWKIIQIQADDPPHNLNSFAFIEQDNKKACSRDESVDSDDDITP